MGTEPIEGHFDDFKDIVCGKCGKKLPSYIRAKRDAPVFRWRCSCGAMMVVAGVFSGQSENSPESPI